jgi:hypothetical protein
MPPVVEERPWEREHDGVDAGETELGQSGFDVLAAMARDERDQRDLVAVRRREGGQ